MNAPTNIQIINGPDGKPVFVVMPYEEYLRAYEQDRDLIPHEVVSATVDGASPARAWREYLKLTQAEIAGRLGISQPSYAKQEASENLRPASINKIAAALGITPAQLDF
ncbi:helix-turn-helix domain-containing protein [Collimonas antrihumi]|uniref:helix-turn-helix domain-containing protein n=1 Tax=Collimonas antrihumi TaxID=1940615 RepID=UPI001B8CDCE7|nr:helix-turn-helix transcriptional regulator [Collimonas antrihumi]